MAFYYSTRYTIFKAKFTKNVVLIVKKEVLIVNPCHLLCKIFFVTFLITLNVDGCQIYENFFLLIRDNPNFKHA